MRSALTTVQSYGAAVTTWNVWRQDDNGNRFQVDSMADRVAALARVLAFESGPVHKQTYWVEGPSKPACNTNRDLYQRVMNEGERMTAAGRSLEEFLRAWWRVGKALPVEGPFDLDTAAAMLAAAATVEPPSLSATWRSASFRYVEEAATRADWETIVLSQIADLADFADLGPLDERAYFGVDAPRPDGCVRATDRRWYNFDPRGYLECGMAGSLGGWADEDGIRKPVSSPVAPMVPEPPPGEYPITAISWADLAALARCGQEYE
jgi:hypothetical protein